MILLGWKRSAICRANRRITTSGMLGERSRSWLLFWRQVFEGPWLKHERVRGNSQQLRQRGPCDIQGLLRLNHLLDFCYLFVRDATDLRRKRCSFRFCGARRFRWHSQSWLCGNICTWRIDFRIKWLLRLNTLSR